MHIDSDTMFGAGFIVVLVTGFVIGLSFLVYKSPQWQEEERVRTAHRCEVAFQMADSQHDTLLVVTASNGVCSLTMGETHAD